MYRSTRRAAVVGAVAASALALTAPAALATVQGGVSRTCQINTCQIDPPVWFPGGTLSVDADVHGSGPAEWIVRQDNGGTICRSGFAAEDPPRSWICTGVSAQWLYGIVSGGAPTSNIGLRW
ncbi:hypothetical protein [Amycolatopsis rifamycinica]|uniref:Ig-like domain-containing protein n=1 Tax=Amycolatopsis rifamycinica TaxID=287986 RepID=A0A066UFH1_9PSEU|nr:hypothetical protein [Amycolatopsis rifamycinica]KDN22968.1 hypothetical protein DV20_06745 [Amycolatopsis rifamycinica]